MGDSIKANGVVIKWKAKENSSGQMGDITKGTIKTIANMDMVNSNGLMVGYTKECGSMVNSMERGLSLGKMGKRREAFGAMAIE